MKNLNTKIFYILLWVLVSTTSCQKAAFDAFYNPPATLAPPMYQVLQTKGNFKNLLACVDKAGYKSVLNTAAGYWTLFAPNDSAFTVYFKEKGISGIGAIDSVSARAMLQYWLVYNSYEKSRLADYQATANNSGWTPSQAFRRRTAYYTGFYKDTGVNNSIINALADNHNSVSTSLTGNYDASDYNNKYITYFTDVYCNAHSLNATDYNYFYPSSQYTGFNVAAARVVTKDIAAESGVIHEIDKVISPLMSIDEYIRTRPEYSSFKAILNRLNINNTVQFIYNADATHRYQVLKGKNDSVFIKAYSSLLSYSPNNENFLKLEENDGQKDCWTMFIPNNQAVDDYVKNVLCQNYASLDQMPIGIINDFLNSHLFPTAVWPTKFGVTQNSFSETAKIDPNADVFDRKILSNGILYGTTKVLNADVFSTVFGKSYLNPNYTMMTKLFNVTGLKLMIAKSNVPVNIFLIPDKVFSDSGYTYNVSKDQFEYRPASATASTTNGVYDKLTRIASTCVFYAPYKQQIENLSGADIVKSGDAATDGDYIKFNNNIVTTGGLQDNGRVAKVDSSKTGVNGKVYYLNNILYYSEKPVGTHIKNLGLLTTSDYNYFWQYLSNSSFYNATTTDLNGLTGFNTLFIPNNAAIKQAVNDGILPGTGTAPNKVASFNPGTETDKDLVRKFLQYHILAGHTIIPDGNNTGSFTSFLQNSVGTALKFTIISSPGVMSILDNYNRSANVILSQSNNLSNRCVIHLIDNYLKYKYN
jgi:uncharacterized surface protein with fasciclin (FAS1) repeats